MTTEVGRIGCTTWHRDGDKLWRETESSSNGTKWYVEVDLIEGVAEITRTKNDLRTTITSGENVKKFWIHNLKSEQDAMDFVEKYLEVRRSPSTWQEGGMTREKLLIIRRGKSYKIKQKE